MIKTSYDALNRPLQRWSGDIAWPATTTDPARLASWTYDRAGTRGKGMAWTETTWQDGQPYTTTINDYNGRYQPTQTTISISPAGSGVVPSSLAGIYTYTSQYNEAGQPTSQTFPTGPANAAPPAETVTTGYDGLGHPVTLSGYVSATTFDDLGRITSRTLTTGTAVGVEIPLLRAFDYDGQTGALDEIKGRWDNTTEWFQHDVYTRDIVGNVTTITDNGREPGVVMPATTPATHEASNSKECFVYDKWNRLIRAHTTSITGTCATDTTSTVTDRGNLNAAPYDTVWTFDDINRMTAAVDKKDNITYNYNYKVPGTTIPPVDALNHRITSIDKVTSTGTTTTGYKYAAGAPTGIGVGAMIERGPIGSPDLLAYDAQQRLTSYKKAGSAIPDEQYRYTTSNQRLIRANDTSVTLYLPGLELTDNSGTVTTTSYRSIGGAQVATKIKTSGTTTIRWNCASMQNSATCQVMAAITGANSTTVPKRQRYTPYGDTRNTGDLAGTDHRFLNQPRDTTSGFTYLNNRYYDGTVGIFISVDPLVNKTRTPYLYSSANPTTKSDPSGLDPACQGKNATEGVCTAYGYTYQFGVRVNVDKNNAIAPIGRNSLEFFISSLRYYWNDNHDGIGAMSPDFMERSAAALSGLSGPSGLPTEARDLTRGEVPYEIFGGSGWKSELLDDDNSIARHVWGFVYSSHKWGAPAAKYGLAQNETPGRNGASLQDQRSGDRAIILGQYIDRLGSQFTAVPGDVTFDYDAYARGEPQPMITLGFEDLAAQIRILFGDPSSDGAPNAALPPEARNPLDEASNEIWPLW